jgi:HAD superfamily hydrolase (TIGR01549 family)
MMMGNGKHKRGSIKAVIFDLDGTIRYSEPRGVDEFHRLVANKGVVFSENQRKSAERWLHYYWAQSPELVDDIERFGDSGNGNFWRQHARRHLELLGVPKSDVEDLSELITDKLAVVSNRHEQFSDLLEELKMLEYFDLTLAAGEVGWWKPDPRLLEYAIEVLDVEPASSVYVGDNYYADVLGARAAGLSPILVDPFAIYESPDCTVIAKISEIKDVIENGRIPASSP